MTSQPEFASEPNQPGAERHRSRRSARISPIDALSLREIEALSAPAEDVDETWRRLLFFQAVRSDEHGPVREALTDRPALLKDETPAEADNDDLVGAESSDEELGADPSGEAQPPSAGNELTAEWTETDIDRAMASTLLKEAGETRDRLVAEAQSHAVDIMDQARDAATREATETRRQVLAEVKQALSRIEALAADTVQAALAEATATVDPSPSSGPLSAAMGGTAANGTATNGSTVKGPRTGKKRGEEN